MCFQKLKKYSSFFSDYYFTNLLWADGQTVSVTWMDRAQTMNIVMLCKASSGDCNEVTSSYTIVFDRHLKREIERFTFLKKSLTLTIYWGEAKRAEDEIYTMYRLKTLLGCRICCFFDLRFKNIPGDLCSRNSLTYH